MCDLKKCLLTCSTDILKYFYFPTQPLAPGDLENSPRSGEQPENTERPGTASQRPTSAGSHVVPVPANQRPDSASSQRLPPKINAVHPREEDAMSVVSAKSKGRNLLCSSLGENKLLLLEAGGPMLL